MTAVRRRVGIIGSGIAGLAAAQYLSAQQGISVTVFEAAREFGGRANVTADGEHCPRFFLEDYTYLFELLREVSLDRGSVYDSFQRVRRIAITPNGRRVEIDHLYASRARELTLREKWVNSRENRRSLLVAKRESENSNSFGAAANFSARGLYRALRNLVASRSAFVLPGGTDELLVQPWVAHLRRAGVEFRAGARVDSFSVQGEHVTVTLGSIEERFDAIIVTAFAPDAYALLDRSNVARRLDWRTHTHCRCFTIELDPREPVLTYPDPRVFSSVGMTSLLQPDVKRCIALAITTPSTATQYVVDRVSRDLDLVYPPLSIRARDNSNQGEAVFIGDYVNPETLDHYVDSVAGGLQNRRVFFAGSYTANSYPVDSAEGAVRSAYLAVGRLSEAHPELFLMENRAARERSGVRFGSRPLTLPPAALGGGTTTSPTPDSHPNSPASARVSRTMWRLACGASVLTAVTVARVRFLDQAQASWPMGQPAVYVATHRSVFDVVAGLLTFRRLGVHPCLVVAPKYFKGSAGRALASIGAMPAFRGSNATVNAAIAAIRAGSSVAFMVEGRVVDPLEASQAKHGRGAFEVAMATGAPIVPISAWGTDRPWPRPRPWPLVRYPRVPIAIAIGDPIVPEGSSREDLMKAVRRALELLERDAAATVSSFSMSSGVAVE